MLRSPRPLSRALPRTLATSRTSPTFPDRADAVVVGAGPAGAATAYHLKQMGLMHVLLLDSQALPSATKPPQRTALLAARFNASDSELVRNTRDLASECLQSQPGSNTGVVKRPHLVLASSAARAIELERLHSVAQYHRLESELLSPAVLQQSYPFLNANDLELGLLLPDDAIFNPDQFSFSVAQAASHLGAHVHLGVEVEEILVRNGRVEGVRTPQGMVHTSVVVCAAGADSKSLCKPLGVHLPFMKSSPWGMAASHEYQLPSITDLDSSAEVVHHGRVIQLQGSSSRGLSQDKSHDLLNHHLSRVPMLRDVTLSRSTRIECSTPDRRPLFGESLSIGGLFLNCGFNSKTLPMCGGLGKELAQLIVEGGTSISLFNCDVSRFLPKYTEDPDWLEETVAEAEFKTSSKPKALDQPLAGRGRIKSPFYNQMMKFNPFNGVTNSYERALFYLPDLAQTYEPSPYDVNSPEAPSNYSQLLKSLNEPHGRERVKKAIEEEVKECRTNVVVFEQSSFGKLWLRGPDSLQALEWICSNKVSRPVGSIMYTLLLNDRAGIEADLTVTRLTDSDFLLVTGAPFRQYNMSLIQKEIIRQGFNCSVSDVTEDFGVLNLQGPKSRHLLNSLTDSDISGQALPYMQCKEIRIGETENILAQRMTFAGELGFELYIPKKDCAKVFDRVMATGVRPVGMATLNLLSIEKGFKHWSAEITCEDNPLQAGLSFVCKLKSGIPFKGREELLRLKAQGPSKRLRGFELPSSVTLSGGELIYRNGEIRGMVKRTGRSFTLDKTIAYGYIKDPENESTSLDYVKSGDYAIECKGVMHKAQNFGGALYDSKGLRVKE